MRWESDGDSVVVVAAAVALVAVALVAVAVVAVVAALVAVVVTQWQRRLGQLVGKWSRGETVGSPVGR